MTEALSFPLLDSSVSCRILASAAIFGFTFKVVRFFFVKVTDAFFAYLPVVFVYKKLQSLYGTVRVCRCNEWELLEIGANWRRQFPFAFDWRVTEIAEGLTRKFRPFVC